MMVTMVSLFLAVLFSAYDGQGVLGPGPAVPPDPEGTHQVSPAPETAVVYRNYLPIAGVSSPVFNLTDARRLSGLGCGKISERGDGVSVYVIASEEIGCMPEDDKLGLTYGKPKEVTGETEPEFAADVVIFNCQPGYAGGMTISWIGKLALMSIIWSWDDGSGEVDSTAPYTFYTPGFIGFAKAFYRPPNPNWEVAAGSWEFFGPTAWTTFRACVKNI